YSSGGNIFNDTLQLINASNGQLRMANTTEDIFNGVLIIHQRGNNITYIGYNGATTLINNHCILNSTQNSSGIRFGQNNGTVQLQAGAQIMLGDSGFTSGQLRFKNFIQLGNTSQSINLTQSALLYQEIGTIWNGKTT